jgi:hypothetical protein
MNVNLRRSGSCHHHAVTMGNFLQKRGIDQTDYKWGRVLKYILLFALTYQQMFISLLMSFKEVTTVYSENQTKEIVCSARFFSSPQRPHRFLGPTHPIQWVHRGKAAGV